mgnify:CR=1
MQTGQLDTSYFRSEFLESSVLGAAQQQKNSLSSTLASCADEKDSEETELLDLNSHKKLLDQLDRSCFLSNKIVSTLRDPMDLQSPSGIEQDLWELFNPSPVDKAPPFVATTKKTRKFSVKKQEAGKALIAQVGSRLKKKVILQRFTMRSNKDARVLNKIKRTKFYWRGESQAIPNIFRLVGQCPEEPGFVLEHADFSKKEVLADEVEGFSDLETEDV